MNGKKRTIRSVFLTIIIIFAIIGISVFFLMQMNKSIENTTLSTIGELAEHDRTAIQNFLDMKWYELRSIKKRFEDCDTILEVQERMNQERASSEFNNLYLVDENGTVYTDRYTSYPREQIDVLQYFEDDDEQIVKRHDYDTPNEARKETLLYGIRLDNYSVEGVKFVALAGITNISEIQNKMMISSFVRGNEQRGYSSVVNLNGDYIVNVNKTVSPNKKMNLYDLLEKSSKAAGWGREKIVRNMKKRKVFSFYVTDEEGVEKLLYFMPIETTSWYFLSMVEKDVFTEQSRSFSFLSLTMLVTVIVIVVSALMFFMFSHDKTVKAKAETKVKNDFLANMSHEIRTPLNGIIGLLHLMRMHVQDNNTEQMSVWIDKAHSTANYLLSLVSNVLDMTKLQEGKFEFISEPFMLESMIDELWTMQHANIENRGINFIIEKNITAPYVLGNKLRIKQVMMNIIGNAAKFTPEGGSIKLSVQQEQSDETHVITRLICEDTGIGMSQQFLETIWDSFTQEHNTKTSNIRGTGLGMALSKQFVDAMGGDILVKSKVNVGSTFTVILPMEIAEDIPDMYDTDTEADAEPEKQHPIRLLIAEDNKLNAEILKEILKSKGYEIVLAENGQIAVDKFAESEPGEYDFILMDMQMPILDGCQATEQIRSMNRPDAQTIPIFACTANAFQEDKTKALKSGMNDFLVKPIDINALLEKLSKNRAGKKSHYKAISSPSAKE